MVVRNGLLAILRGNVLKRAQFSTTIYTTDNGYKYDARFEPLVWDSPEFDDSSWLPCKIMNPPRGKLVSGVSIPATKIVGYLKPREYYSPKPGVLVFDFGQNMSGWVRLKVRGFPGTEIKIRYAEIINPDGSLNTATLGPAEATDVYILRGEGVEILEPRFTYHSFRYVEVTGTPNIPVYR
ncbi:MAG: family 78 glycoside hydrolase catalytic domain [Ignisphaera sp.]